MALSRREFVRRAAVGAGVLAVGNVAGLYSCAAPARTSAVAGGASGAQGSLVADPAGILDLPPGFTYRVLSEAGGPLRGGGGVPGRFDGTGAFPGPGGSVHLVRNHEQGASGSPSTIQSGTDPALVYDPGGHGGTSTLVLDASGARVDEYVSLAGTYNNCAGGVTPWGTWLTCEETETRAGDRYRKDHGFVFEVDPVDPTNNEHPTPLLALGRFAHEAACIDPGTGAVYLTEDASEPNGLLYKCEPADRSQGYGSLRAGGTLFAMRCRNGGAVAPDLSAFTEPGTELDVEWRRVPDPLAAAASTRRQFADGGDTSGEAVTRSQKFEGAWWGNGKAYIVCSYARPGDGSVAAHDGQVWSLDPAAGTLTLEVRLAVNRHPEDAGADQPDGPDNITVTPWGGLMVCEDGAGAQHLLAVAPDGRTSVFARNRRDRSEFAGVTFSPDGRTLFANLQQPGITFAITGPFESATTST